ILDLNDRGDLAGTYANADGTVHGFIVDKNGFSTIDDPAQGIPSTNVSGLSDGKTISGAFFDANLNFRSFTLAHGVFQPVDVPGAIGTSVAGLNDVGALVGVFFAVDGVQHGFLRSGDQFTSFDFPGAVGNTVPFQINDPGTIVGIYFDDTGLHSFIAEQQPGSSP